jgi:hypothetical protein
MKYQFLRTRCLRVLSQARNKFPNGEDLGLKLARLLLRRRARLYV